MDITGLPVLTGGTPASMLCERPETALLRAMQPSAVTLKSNMTITIIIITGGLLLSRLALNYYAWNLHFNTDPIMDLVFCNLSS